VVIYCREKYMFQITEDKLDGEERSTHKVLVGRPEETIQKERGVILKWNLCVWNEFI